jgi:GSH-dependent disulfide-bond oxidoreductase
VIELYTWTTPNGRKISIALEELGLAYKVREVNLDAGEQFAPEFLKISPNNKIPAMVDRDTGRAMMESGAILLYLAKKTGRLMPDKEDDYWQAMEWLMWQMGNFGPMLGQNHHFRRYAPERIDYAIRRYEDEAHRLYGVLNKRLAGRDHVAGDYSIADMAILGWTRGHARQGIAIHEFSNVRRWLDALLARPAVQRGFAVGKDRRIDLATDAEARRVLFGQRARRAS